MKKKARPQVPAPSPVQAGPGAADGGAVWVLAAMLLLAPAAGSSSEHMLQDTLKSAIVSIAALAAAVLFLWRQRSRGTPLEWHAVLWLPLLLLAYALGSILWSHRYLASVEAVRWFVFAAIVWLGLNTFTRERLPRLAACIHAGAVVASLWAALQFWFAFNLFPQGPNPASTFINRNFFAEFVVCTLPFGALLLARARRPAPALLLAVSNGFVLTAILMTGTRGALIAMWLQLLLVLPLIAWRCRGALAFAAWPRVLKAAAPVLLVAAVLVLGLIPSRNPKILEEGYGATALARGTHRAQSIGPRDYSLNVRMVMWRATMRAIEAKPLAGLGAGAWESEIPLYQDGGEQLETDYYVHNEFLQLVAEYGVVAWIFLLLLAAYLLQAAWRTWRAQGEAADGDRPWRVAFLCSLLALMVVSNIGFPWRMAATGALFAVCLGGLAASDARLGFERRWGARPLKWTPLVGKCTLAGAAGCLALALFITQRAAEAEDKLVSAAQIALGITASGDPRNPMWNEPKHRMLHLVREGIAIAPHYRKITPMVADELARWGDWADATWIWESVLDSRPYVVAILANAARGHDAQGHPNKALVYLERARRLQPRAPTVRSLEVLLLARAGRAPEAMQRAQQALDDGVVDYDLVNSYFILAWRAKDYPLAQRLLDQRMRQWPDSRGVGLVQLGLIYAEGLDEHAKAVAAFQQALRVAKPQERGYLFSQIPVAYRAEAAAPQTSASSR